MIQNDRQLGHALEQLDRMYRALAELRSRICVQSPSRYQLMAEGPVEEIRRLQGEIEAYLGVFAEEPQAKLDSAPRHGRRTLHSL